VRRFLRRFVFALSKAAKESPHSKTAHDRVAPEVQMDTTSCPFCGRRPERFAILAFPAADERGMGCAHRLVTIQKFDQVMNWVVGMLLVASMTALVVLQTWPQY
jgi:hypothetical protein